MNRKVHLIGVGNRNNDINLLSETTLQWIQILQDFQAMWWWVVINYWTLEQ